jgi:hypothetical protein
MKSLPHLQTMPNRQQLLLRDAKKAKRGIETSRYDWEKLARPNQLPPPGDWRGWLLLACQAADLSPESVAVGAKKAVAGPGVCLRRLKAVIGLLGGLVSKASSTIACSAVSRAATRS